ncbi:G-type lectin S-receptor-like serine/threonine protein kinase RLK1-like, partial [Trifolium medium]|nr:G-type lectin S-receptor-like serine/threonine protein kinase RLK1-like [Trifolium medium]
MSGTIILADQQGQEKLIVNANSRVSSASMLDSGNFVLYSDNNNSSIIWQSFDHPTDTLLGSQSLPSGGQLSSSLSETNHSTGKFLLNMQVDGNLVLYPAYTAESLDFDAYWTSDTGTASGSVNVNSHLYLNKTGLLQIWNSNSDYGCLINTLNDAEEYQNTGGNQTIYRATLNFDGFFRLHAHYVNNGSDKIIARFPKIIRTCEVKGFCGFNSYCTINDDKQFCSCLNGYKFIDENERTLGCERNYSKVECRGDKD